ncbi:MAG: hypothetical protein H0Z24_09110 [Thermosipho sp. (in: Bacteria)]|nr:hypothetical protein [Thermosipho sp. (in: thermotogales)]
MRQKYEKIALGWDRNAVWPFHDELPRKVHIPDVALIEEYNNYSNIIVIEVQRSRISKKEFKERMDFYSRYNVFTIWIFANYRKMKNISKIVRRFWGVNFIYYLPRQEDDFREDELMLLAYKFRDSTYYKADLPLKDNLHFAVTIKRNNNIRWGLAFIPYSRDEYIPIKRNSLFLGYFPKKTCMAGQYVNTRHVFVSSF